MGTHRLARRASVTQLKPLEYVPMLGHGLSHARRLGIGVIHVSMVHYNTLEQVDRFIEAMSEVIAELRV